MCYLVIQDDKERATLSLKALVGRRDAGGLYRPQQATLNCT
jgi:hypothetical protein